MPNPVVMDWNDVGRGRGIPSVLDASRTLIYSDQFATAPPSQAQPKGGVKVGGVPQKFYLPVEDDSLESSLFTNRAALKIITSQVAMHLTEEERRSLFFAIDSLLGIDNWEEDSSKIDERAYRSYLRFMIYARPRKLANLGVKPGGALLAGWHNGAQSVHVEFLPGDQCVALIKSISIRGPEKTAWRGHVARLRPKIESNDAVECLD